MKKILWTVGLGIMLMWGAVTPLLAQSDNKPALMLSPIGGYGGGGLATFSSLMETKVKIYARNTSGPAKIEIYSTTLDQVMNYLTHDEKYYQIKDQIEVEKLTKLSEMAVNLTQGEDNQVSLPINENGIYYLQVVQNDLKSGLLVMRSSIGSVAREAKDTLVVWTQDFGTKRSVAGARISLYNLEGRANKIAEVNADGVGIASLPLTASADLMVTEANNSVAIVPLNARYLNDSHWGNSFIPNQVSKKYFIFTDRPIYQPGDVVNFKAIIRDDDDGRYSKPQGMVAVAIGQGYENENFLYKNNLAIDVNGYIAGNYRLPKDLSPGEYRIIMNPRMIDYPWGSYSGSDDYLYFKVENYRKPEYSLTTESKQFDVVRGDTVEVAVKGEYYSGQPLAKAGVNYKIYTDRYGWGDSEYYYPSNGDKYFRAWNGAEVETGVLTLDNKGRGVVTIPTNKNDSQGRYQVFFVEFTYADASGNQSLSGVNVLVRSGDYSLYRQEDNYVYGGKTGEKIDMPLQLKANRNGLGLNQKVEMKVIRHWWDKQVEANSKYPRYVEIKDDLGTKTMMTDNQGRGVFSFTPEKEGNYEIISTITDSRENVITKSFYLWVSDKYVSYGGNLNNISTLKIGLEKSTYRVGDQALVKINSEIANRDIFLAVERGYQDRYQVVQMTGNTAEVPIEIKEHDMPNIFVTVKSFDNDNLAGDVQNVTIETNSKKIYYQLFTDKTEYGPGDEVTVNVSAKDAVGNPVESNLALWAVDKSIYALADVNYGDIFNNFWSFRENGTMQSHSLEDIMIGGGAEKGGCFLPGTKILMADGGKKIIEMVKTGDEIMTYLSAKSNKLVPAKVVGTHQAETGGYLIINGKLKVTRNHRLLVNGRWATAGTIKLGDELKGEGGQVVKVTSLEYLSLKSPVYNLTTEGYHTYIADGIYVHNEKGGGTRDNFADTAYWNASVNTNSQGMVQIKFRLPDNLTTWVITTIGASADTKVGQAFTEIKTNKDLVIRPVLANIWGENDTVVVSALVHNFTEIDIPATVTFKTDGGKLLDQATIKTEVGANDYKQVSWRVKVGAGKSEVKVEFEVNNNRGKSDKVVQNIPIRAPGVWNQTSAFKIGTNNFDLEVPQKFIADKSMVEVSLSSSLVGSLPTAMKYLVNYPYGCVEQTTSSLTAKLVALKYRSLFGEAVKNMSNRETIEDGLSKLKQLQNYDGSWSWWWKGSKSEVFVSAYVWRVLNMARELGYVVDERMYNRAKDYLNNNFDQADLKTQIIKAYGLAFSSDPKLYKTITADLSGVDDDYLAMATYANLVAGMTDETRNGVDLLANRAKMSETGAYWVAGEVDRFGANETSTALAIQAFQKSKSRDELTAKAVNYLLKNRVHDYWSSTYATAQTILALAEFNDPEKGKNEVGYRILAGSTVLSSGKVSNLGVPTTVKLDIAKVAKAGKIQIEKTGEGELYTTVNQKWWIDELKTEAVSKGVRIEKTLVNAKGAEYNLTPGDLVEVKLKVTFDQETPQSNGHALIEDHLPAGLVPVNTNLLNEATSNSPYSYGTDYLKDGVIIPIYYGRGGSREYSYLARVISAGEYYNPPAYFTLMYSPETWARSEAGLLTIESEVKVNPIMTAEKIITEAIKPSRQKNIVVGVAMGLILGGIIYAKIRRGKKIPPISDQS